MHLRTNHLLATILVACSLLGTAYGADLTSVDPQAASRLARNWLRMTQEVAQKRAVAESEIPAPVMQEIGYEGRIVGYLAAFPSGYVVVPAFSELPPVTVYSEQSTLNLNEEDGPALLIKQLLTQKIEAASAALANAASTAEMQPALAQIRTDRRQWSEYAGDYASFTRALARDNQAATLDNTPRPGHPQLYGITSINPLTTTAWHQSAPYYDLDPMGDGGRTVVGCVATAAAQILAFWRNPVNGIGSKSYVWSGDNSCGTNVGGGTLSATFSDAYDWANILDRYPGGETAAQKTAVAELCYETAVAFSMDFGRCGSGASTSNAVAVFPTYFGFATEIRQDNRSAYTTADAWFTMLQEDLNRGWPMQYRIANHSIVCDGWQVAGSNQIHLNYGWADSHTAWYTVDNLYCNWTGCSPTVEFAIRHIHPNVIPTRSLTLSAPNGGEALTAGTTAAIRWSSVSFSENVCIQLNRSYPAGAWETISASTANSGAFNWVVSGAATSAARVRIYGGISAGVGDTSNANFTISAAPPVVSVTVASPNGGETWTVGNVVNVTWTSVSLAENVKIELNRNYSSGTWETIVASATNSSTYSFVVGGTATSAARVRISGTTSTGVRDTSNANFTINAAPPPAKLITVISPNGGESVSLGTVYNVRWSAPTLTGNLRVQLNRNYPAGRWENIVSSTGNDGSQMWIVSGSASSHARIRVLNVSNLSVGDTSDTDFSIAAASTGGAVTVLSPNGGAQLVVGTLHRITWDAPTFTESLCIQINRSYPSGPWETITAVTNNDGSYSWGVTGPVTGRARVRVTAVYNGTVTDISNADFAIAGMSFSPGASDQTDVPTQTRLDGAYPNPFNPTTTIRFDLAAASPVRLDLYDITGRLVSTLINDVREAGHYSVTCDGRQLSTGVYFVRLSAGAMQSVQRIQLLK